MKSKTLTLIGILALAASLAQADPEKGAAKGAAGCAGMKSGAAGCAGMKAGSPGCAGMKAESPGCAGMKGVSAQANLGAAAGKTGSMHTTANSPVCPVDGLPVKPGRSTWEYEGVTYSFCCHMCLEKFQANPAEFATASDPVTHQPIKMKDAAATTLYDGKMYYFATAESRAMFDKAPATYATFTCPVCGMTQAYADAKAKVEKDGKTYRFCSPGCATAFSANPAQYPGKTAGTAQASM
jgi:YHS domain-containing protein